MENATITEVKNRFSSFLDKVKQGESILITERGRPVARLESALAACPDDIEGRLGRLERVGLVRRAKIKSDAESIVAAELTKLKPESSLLQAVLAERKENR